MDRYYKALERRRDWLQANAQNTYALAEKQALNYVLSHFEALRAEQVIQHERERV